MKGIKIIGGILAAVMLLSLVACGNSDLPGDTSGGSDTDDTPDSGKTVVYELPAGAESEYALYTTVVDYLNNGFHYDDLNDVYDPVLTAVAIFTRPEGFLLDVKYDELCALLVKLRGTWSKIQTMLDTYEDIDAFCDAFRSEFPGYLPDGVIESDAVLDDDLIYKLFQDQCPESLQAEINANRDKFEDWVDAGVLHNAGAGYIRDGENPYRSDQTVWEKMSEDELGISEFKYDEEYENLADTFPQMYFMEIGEYREEEGFKYLYEMEIIYTKIEGRYYLINFTGAVI